jgi:hypothetical protein
MLVRQQSDHIRVQTEVVEEALQCVAAELLLIDLVDLVTYIRTEQFSNLEDLINSSVELLFKPGTLSFGWAADVDVRWGSPPTVRLDMEFRHMSVTVFFSLSIGPLAARVDIYGVSFDGYSQDPAQNTERLISAIDDARRTFSDRDGGSSDADDSPCGMIGGIEETSASYEARSAPRSYPTCNHDR